MPGRHEVRYLPSAQADLHSILDWIAADDPEKARAFIEDIERRIGRLETLPLLGRVPRNERLRKMGYRVLILGVYVVFYKLLGRTVQIHRVVHGARQLGEIL